MAKLSGVPAGREQFRAPPDLESFKFVEAQVNKGMITMIDPADIPPGAFQLIKNANVRFDRTARRVGSILLVPSQPDTNAVLKMASIKKKEGTTYTTRFTPSTVFVRNAGIWSAIAGTLTGTTVDRIQTAVVNDELIFANNGADPIHKIDFLANTHAQLGNAPAYRYITGFYGRALGAARRDTNEVEVGWSALDDIEEWNPAVDETAGSSAIMESPADLSDFITGIFSWTNIGVLLRERSLWTIQKQTIPQNPFFFSTAVPGIGCDSPYSAQIIGNAIAWLDRRTGSVYAWQPGSNPEPIGRPIETSLLNNIDDPSTIFSSYDNTQNEYSVCIPQVGSDWVAVWTYNLRTKAWVKNEYYAITAIDDIDLSTAGITIDQLGDIAIDDLSGTINSLSPTGNIITTRVFGRDDGSIAQIDTNADMDAPHTVYPSGISYETSLISKAFAIPEKDIYVAEVVIEYQCSKPGTLSLKYSKSGGVASDWIVAKDITVTDLGKPKLFIFRKFIRTRKFAFRFSTSDGLFDVLSFEIHAYPSGKSRQ